MTKPTVSLVLLAWLVLLSPWALAQTTAPSTLPVDEALLEATKEAKEAQRRGMLRHPDGGTLQHLSQLLTISLVDGKLKPAWITGDKFPGGRGGIRYQVNGIEAIWALQQSTGGGRGGVAQGTSTILSRLEPDRSDANGPWSIHLMDFTYTDGRHVLAINADWGPSADRDIVYFESDLATGASVLTVRSRERTLVNAQEPTLRLLLEKHPDAVQRYLNPLFRDVNGPVLGVP